MALFRYPVRPLTDAGRVCLCIALSVLAAVLLMISPPTHADDLAAAVTPGAATAPASPPAPR
jgi:hypothetical protein